MGVFFAALFGILDYLLIPRVLEQIWFIRYVILCPCLLFSFALTWTPYAKKLNQFVMVSVILISGFGIIAMTVIAYPPGSYYYYAGLLLVLLWCYTITTARFVYASFAGWMLVMVYEIVAIFSGAFPPPVVISNSFFFISGNIIGMLACRQIEIYKRKEFWQQRLIGVEKVKSDKILQGLNEELQLASDIQKGLLPAPSLTWHGCEIACYCKPTLDIGGDFYSYHFIDQVRFGLAVGDASGHGISAALMMAATLSHFDASFEHDLDPCERLSLLDHELEAYCNKRYQNCAFCYLELEANHAYIANAGGIPPFVWRSDGQVQMLDIGGLPLGHGLGAELGYAGKKVPLQTGDFIVLCSDGVIEAKDGQEMMFGFKRLEQVIAGSPGASAQAVLNHIIQQVMDFADLRTPQDDFTIAVLRFAS